MKARTKFYMILVAVFCLILYVASANAQALQARPNTLPVFVEAHAVEGTVLLVLYYPDSETLCFMNDGSKACIPIQDFAPAYKQLVQSKVEASKQEN